MAPQITWQAVQDMPEDGRRYEAIGGEMYVTAAPIFRHQRITYKLSLLLGALLEHPGHGILAGAPGVEFPATREGVQPDLVFVSNRRTDVISDKGLVGPPDLVIEILSPSTKSRDRGVKLDLYERQGVGEYWIVDHEAEAVDVWRFDSDPRHERFTKRLPVRVGDEPVGEIDLEELFAPD